MRSTKSGIQNGTLMLGEVKMKSHLIAVFFTLMVVLRPGCRHGSCTNPIRQRTAQVSANNGLLG